MAIHIYRHVRVDGGDRLDTLCFPDGSNYPVDGKDADIEAVYSVTVRDLAFDNRISRVLPKKRRSISPSILPTYLVRNLGTCQLYMVRQST